MPLSQLTKLFTSARPYQHNFLILLLWPMNVIQINFIIYDQFAFVQFNFPRDKWNPSFSSWLQMKLITLSPLWEAAPHDKVSRSVDGRTTSCIVRFFNYFPQTAIKPLYKYIKHPAHVLCATVTTSLSLSVVIYVSRDYVV